MRSVYLIFGLAAYVLFNGVFAYFGGFLFNFYVPKSIDFPAMETSVVQALVIDGALLALFAVHHSLVPRTFFKEWQKKHIPPPLERSVYVMVASLLLALLMWQWQPVPWELWRVESVYGRWIVTTLFVAGVFGPLAASFQIDHYDLFGLRQVLCCFRNIPYTPPKFEEKGMYRVVRHPIMLGTLLALWATPTMTAGHLLLAVVLTVYIFVGIFLEERDAMAALGAPYATYQERVPMIIPSWRWPR